MEFEARNGWYSLQLFWKIDWSKYKEIDENKRKEALAELVELAGEFEQASKDNKGSYAFGRVIGHKSDFAVMLLHEDIGQLTEWQDQLKRLDLFNEAELNISYLSVHEVTNYLIKKLNLENPHVQDRLYPRIGDERYFCFYPMSRKREWFSIPTYDRQKMLASHGRIGAGYAEELKNHISNSIGLDDYHWAVTLWGNDFQQFKNIIYEMRFDKAGSDYGIFPYFVLGEQIETAKLENYFLNRSDV